MERGKSTLEGMALMSLQENIIALNIVTYSEIISKINKNNHENINRR
jgi:hypothetical protein